MSFSDTPVEDLLIELKQLQDAQTAEPSNPDPPHQCGLIYARLGDHASAIRSYHVAVERNPRFVEAHFNLALAYSAQGRFPEAESTYRRVVWLNDGDHEAWANLGALYEAQERNDDALACYKKAVQINPVEKEARHRIGNIYLRRADWDRADGAFEEAIAIDEGDYEAWNSLGLAAYHRGRDDIARDYYLKAIQINDGYARAWCNLGNTFARKGDEKAAEQAYREALDREQEDADLWFNLGEFYLRRGRQETENCLLNAVKLNADDLEAWELLRQWNTRHPNLPVWKTALKVLLNARPDDMSLLREMATVHDQMGESEEALAVLRQLIALDASDEASHLMLARLYLSLSRTMEAFTHMGKLSTTSDDVLDLWYKLGQRLLHQNHLKEAESCFLTLAAHRPLQTDPWHFLGELAFQRGELDLAYERFTRAVDVNRNDAGVWLPLARGFLEHDQTIRALSCLENLSEHLSYLPGDWGLFFNMHSRAGQGAAFLEKLETLMEAGTLANHLWLNLAELYTTAGMELQSRRCFSRLEAGGLTGEAGELALARFHIRARDGKKALEYLDRFMESQADHAAYWNDRGEATYLLGDLAEARTCYERALELGQDDFRIWFKLGNIFYRIGKPDDAQHAFLNATKLDPQESRGWYNLGLVQNELGLEARISLRKAISIDRRMAHAWNALGVIHFRAEEDVQARRCFVRCVAVNRDSVYGWHNLASCDARLGRDADATQCMGHVKRLGGLPAEGSRSAVRLFFDHDGPVQSPAEAQPAAEEQQS